MNVGCIVSSSLCILHALYKAGGLAFAYCFVPSIPLHQLIIHAILVMACGMCGFWYYKIYIQRLTESAAYVNLTLLGNTGGLLDERDGLKSHWKARMREYSLQHLIAISLPCMIMLAVLVVTAVYIYDPSMRLLIYAALPTAFRTWMTFGLCLMEEIRLMLVFSSVIVPVWQLQIISYDLVSKQLRLLKRRVETGRQNVLSVYRNLRGLQLYVSLVNDVNSYIIFTWKLMSITLCIISGYAAIAHFSEYPIFGIMYYVLVFDGILIYTLMYEKSFNIPELFDQVIGYSLLRMRGPRDNVLRRQMRSIPRTGIKVGNFHVMERESTLIFIDYVVKNIVNMLVAYG